VNRLLASIFCWFAVQKISASFRGRLRTKNPDSCDSWLIFFCLPKKMCFSASFRGHRRTKTSHFPFCILHFQFVIPSRQFLEISNLQSEIILPPSPSVGWHGQPSGCPCFLIGWALCPCCSSTLSLPPYPPSMSHSSHPSYMFYLFILLQPLRSAENPIPVAV
jgi:hypothetical protein